MSNILVKFPSRERPRKFRDCLANILDTASGIHNVVIYATLDNNDKSMEWCGALKKSYFKAIYGDSDNKIHAVNRDMGIINQEFDWDILLLMSDDMKLVSSGWDDVINGLIDLNSPQILHCPTDHFHGERIITMPILNRKWYDYFGYIYNPIYESLYADDEQTEVSKKLGFYKKCDIKIAEHLNFIYTQEKPDDLFIKTQSYASADEKRYQERKALNFI